MRENCMSIDGILAFTLNKWSKDWNWLKGTLGYLIMLALMLSIVVLIMLFLKPFNVQAPIQIVPYMTLLIVLGPLAVYLLNGMVIASLNFGLTGRYKISDYIKGYKNFFRVLITVMLMVAIMLALLALPLGLVMILKMRALGLLTILLMYIPCMILYFVYSQTLYLLHHEGLGPVTALRRSRQIMKGNKGRLFGVLAIITICLIPLNFISEAINSTMITLLIMLVEIVVSSLTLSIKGVFYAGFLPEDSVEGDEASTSFITNEETEVL